MGRFTLDDIIGGICLLAIFWGLPWIAAFAEYVVTP